MFNTIARTLLSGGSRDKPITKNNPRTLEEIWHPITTDYCALTARIISLGSGTRYEFDRPREGVPVFKSPYDK